MGVFFVSKAPRTRPDDTPRVRTLVTAARELDAALEESCEKETALWLEPKSSDRVYRARCAMASALYNVRAIAKAKGETA